MAKRPFNLRELRRELSVDVGGVERKVTQQRMAQMLGIPQSVLGNYEAGRRRPTIDNAQKILRFFHNRGFVYTLEELYRAFK